MFGLTYCDFHQKLKTYKHHVNRLREAKATVDTSKPKAKLKCTKQPFSQFNRLFDIQIQNRHLFTKLAKPSASVQHFQHQPRSLVKNNRKKYYEDHERNIQNEGLIRRIRSAKTSYGQKRLLKERKQNQIYMQMISRFGFHDKINKKFRFNVNMLAKESQIKSGNKSRALTLRNNTEVRNIQGEEKQLKPFQLRTLNRHSSNNFSSIKSAQNEIEDNISKRVFQDKSNLYGGSRLKKIGFKKGF